MTVDRRSFLRLGASATVAAAAGTGLAASTRSRPARASGVNWDALRAMLSGDVVLPGDAGYEQAIQLQVATYDAIRPQAVVYCESATDVSRSLLFARYNGLQIAPRSGGHSNAGYSTTTGAVIDLSRINQVTTSTTAITVGAGIQAVDALTVLAPQGLTTPNGTCATVAAGGFITGGGTGLLTRKHGMGCDALLSAEVVLADGRVVTASPTQKSDLYWALRGGGGGNFGVVTQYRLKPIAVTRMVSYSLVWPWATAAQALTAWQGWIGGLAPDIAANLLIVLPDAAPGAVPVVQVSGSSLGAQADLETKLDELTSLVGSAPVARTVVDQTYQQAMMQTWGCATRTPDQCHRIGTNPEAQLPRNVFALTRGRFFDGLSSTGIDAVLTAFDQDRRAGQQRVASFRAMGGEANEKTRTETAFVHRTSKFYFALAYGLTNPAATEEDKAAMTSVLGVGFTTLSQYANGEAFQNFMDPGLTDWRAAYYGENYARLVQTKQKYDPGNFFRFGQSIGS